MWHIKSAQHYLRTIEINGAGKYIIGDSRGRDGLNEIRLGAFIPYSEPEPDDTEPLPPSDTLFTDSRGNTYRVTTGDPTATITIRECNRESSHYFESFKIPLLENLLVIESDSDIGSMAVTIYLADDDYVPISLYKIHPNGDIELYPFFFDEVERTIEFVIHEGMEFTFMPIAVQASLIEPLAFDITKQMFNIVRNEGGTVEISLDFLRNYPRGSNRYYWLPNQVFYTVTDHSGNIIAGGSNSIVANNDFNIRLNGLSQGVYTITLAYRARRLNTIWSQDIFVEGTQRAWTEWEISNIASRFAPILVLHREEEFYPVSLDYLFGSQVPNFMQSVEMRIDDIHGGHRMNYRNLINILPFNGHRYGLIRNSRDNSFHQFTGSPQNATIYYSYIEGNNEIFINYHMFYAFDPKDAPASNPATGWHSFDRESFVMVFNKATREPIRAIFPAHMENHDIRIYGERRQGILDDSLQSWTGRVSIDFSHLNTFEGRPILSIARGAHGVLPIGTDYATLPIQLPIIQNITPSISAGRAGIIEPIPQQFLTTIPTNYSVGRKIFISNTRLPNSHTFNTYTLNRLNLNATSDTTIAQNILAFSGFFVQLTGPNSISPNAKFPPFTECEATAQSWVDNSTDIFNWRRLDSRHINSLRNLNIYLAIHAPGRGRTITVGSENISSETINISYSRNNSTPINIQFNAINVRATVPGGGTNRFTYIDAEQFFNLLDVVANTNSSGTMVDVRRLVRYAQISAPDFTVNVGNNRGIINIGGHPINTRVYTTTNDNRVFAHIRYLEYLFNLNNQHANVRIGYNNINGNISIIY